MAAVLETSGKKRWLGIVIGLAVGLAVGVAIGPNSEALGLESDSLGWLLLGLGLGGGLCTVWHELGHVVAGKLAGFDFVLLTVGSFRIVRERGALRFRRGNSLVRGGGAALLVPRSGETSIGRLAFWIAGGPVFNLLGGASLLVWVQQMPPAQQSRFGFFVVTIAAINLLFGVLALLPLGASDAFRSDGSHLLDLLKGGSTARRELLLYAVLGESVPGARPRSWSSRWIEPFLAQSDDEADQLAAVASYYGYYRALDCGEWEAAGAHLDKVLACFDVYPVSLQDTVRLEAVFFEARYRQRLPEARALWDAAKDSEGFVETHQRARAEAALLWLEGKSDEAAQAVQRGLDSLPQALDQGIAAAEREWLEAIRRDVRAELPEADQNDQDPLLRE